MNARASDWKDVLTACADDIETPRDAIAGDRAARQMRRELRDLTVERREIAC